MHRPFVVVLLTGRIMLSVCKKYKHVGTGGNVPLIFNISSG
jgi:hypothetical protein